MDIGGLGNYAILFAKALGIDVYVFAQHSPNKADNVCTQENVRTDSIPGPYSDVDAQF